MHHGGPLIKVDWWRHGVYAEVDRWRDGASTKVDRWVGNPFIKVGNTKQGMDFEILSLPQAW